VQKSLLKKLFLTPISHLSVLVFILLGIYVPPIEGEQIRDIDTSYWSAAGTTKQSIGDILSLPANHWSRTDHRPWLQILNGPQEAWTKVQIPARGNDKKLSLVAEINFPMHRDIEYYLVQNGVLIDSYVPSTRKTERATNISKYDSDFNHAELPSAFMFAASSKDSLDLYAHSTILGARLPRPSIMTSQNYSDQRNFFDLLLGALIGANVAILLYNLAVGLMLRQIVYHYFTIFILGIVGVAFTASGIAERIFPSLAYDHNLYSLITAECVALGVLGICLFESGFYQLSVINRDVKATHRRLGVIAAAASMILMPWIGSAQRPLFLTLVMIAAIASNRYATMRQHDLKIVREYRLGIAIFVAPLLISIASWYELIQAHFMRTMFFQFGVFGASIYFSSTVALRFKEIQAKKSQLIRQIKTEAHSAAATGSMAGQLSSAIEEAEVAIMFIDIAAFSQLSAPLSSRLVFDQLSKRLGEIATIIRDLGGNIDRSLGDGLLCFFGYRLGETPESNTRRAFLAGRKIQEHTVASTINAISEGRNLLVMPVRIGIHSSKMLLGNIGGATRIDFTMIGAGVNFASRLEAACSPFKLMLSETCYEHLRILGYEANEFSRVGISIKHKAELVTSYEYDPFRNRVEDLHMAEHAYFQNLGIHTRDQRYQVRSSGSIALRAGHDELVIQDLSRFGFRVLSNKQFGRQTCLSVKVIVPDSALVESLRSYFVDELTIEVRWSRQSSVPGTYQHGVKIVGSSKDQRDFLFETLVANFGEVSASDIEQLSQEVA